MSVYDTTIKGHGKLHTPLLHLLLSSIVVVAGGEKETDGFFVSSLNLPFDLTTDKK